MMNKDVQEKFESYPLEAKKKLLGLRSLIMELASEEGLEDSFEETLKWGEPSYLVKGGSTIRMDWKEKSPDQYALYFNCNSRLVETYRELYSDILTFEGNRAIVFNLADDLSESVEGINSAVKHCLQMALKYHQLKNLPLLGN